MRPSSLTAAQKDDVRRRWTEGESASQIGAALGVTKNTIAGHVERNKAQWNLTDRPKPKRPLRERKPRKPRAPRPRKTRAPTLPKPARHGDAIRAGWVAHKAKAVSVPLPPRPKAVPVGPLPETGTVAYLAWRSGQCHFPHWGNDDFSPFTSMFCGRLVEGESPYCREHRALTRQPLSSSRVARDTREVEAA